MEINGFKVIKENIYGLKVGAKSSTCPFCSHNRKKKNHKCLVIDWAKGIANCYHPDCEMYGKVIQLHEFEKKMNGESKGYSAPKLSLLKPLSYEHRDWLKNVRCLTDKVIDANEIKTSFEFITFPYFDEAGMVNWKQREINKDNGFRQAAGCRQTMYRLKAIKESIEKQKSEGVPIKIIICEGELDALSWEVAGAYYATSISQGAPGENDKQIERKLACIYNDLDVLIQADIIYLSIDNDAPGQRLSLEIRKLVQNHCTVKIIEHQGYKDANKLLQGKGVSALKQSFKEAKEPEKLKIELPAPEEEKENIIRFPIEVFPDFIQELFGHLKSVKHYENSFMAISLMGVIGTVAGCRQIFDSGQYYNRCLLMSAMVAPPSVNKSAPLRDFLKPLQQINSTLRQEYNQELEEYEINEELPKNHHLKRDDLIKPKQKQIVYENATVEAVHNIHSNNDHGLLCKADELRTWFDSLGQYKKSGKGSDVGFYLANFNGDDYTINRVDKSLYIELLHINIVGGIQPDKLTSFPTDNGFLQRFIFALPEDKPKLKSRESVNKKLLQHYNDFITSAYYEFSVIEQDCFYHLTDKSRALFYDYLDRLREQEIDESISSVMSQFIGKLTITFHRLCLIIRIIDHVFDVLKIQDSMFIGVEHVESAIKLTDYFIETTKRVVEKKDTTRELQRVIYGKGRTNKDIILESSKAGFKPKEIADFNGLSRSYVYKVINDELKVKGK